MNERLSRKRVHEMASEDRLGRWAITPIDESTVDELSRELGAPKLLARLLVSRGITDPDEIERFLDPSLDREWTDPYLIPGMEAAAERIAEAVRAGESILVFGDFDVDGLTATTLLTTALRDFGGVARPFIPVRFGEGYGISKEAVERAFESGVPDLMITVDNGIAAKEHVAAVVASGVDVVVTDHHEPADLVPEGVPVVDPKLLDEGDVRELAGVGVALKVVAAVGALLGHHRIEWDYVDLAALGTVSDMMMLTPENRAIVAAGIDRIHTSPRVGISALAQRIRCDLAHVTADSLSYSLIPRLNAAGRVADPSLALEVLMADDHESARAAADRLETVNIERRELESQLAAAALARVEATYDGEKVIVVGDEGWHEGVRGIVASRIMNSYHVPSFVFTISDGVAIGSGRSVGDIDLFKSLESVSDLLIRYGGHPGAVGLTLDAANLDVLRSRLDEYYGSLDPEEFESTGTIDAVVPLGDLTLDAISSLDGMRPFGQGNPVPMLLSRGVLLENRSLVGADGSHFRFTATDGDEAIGAIMFRAPEGEKLVDHEGVTDLVYEAFIEEWQGRVSPKLRVRDILIPDEALDPSSDALEAGAPELVDDLFERADEILFQGEYAGIGDAESFHTKLAGVTFEGRQVLLAQLEEGEELVVSRDMTNAYDPNAIAVSRADGQQVGFLNRRLARVLAPLMDRGLAYRATVDAVTGGGERELGCNITMHRESSATRSTSVSETDGAAERARLAGLPPDRLTDELRRLFIGEHEFLPSQAESLEALRRGESTLSVMATGRGKSLIFHVHAAREAILKGAASVFIYPLRALVSDQSFHLEDTFARVGLSVAVLTGETSLPERDRIFDAVTNGEYDVVLTTPEFLAIHTDRFATTGRIGFLVIDEAHHAGSAHAGNRGAYMQLPRIRAALGEPTVLAVTATASTAIADAIGERAGITHRVIDDTQRTNLHIDDGRTVSRKEARLTSLVATGEKTVVYVNSRDESVRLARMLRKRVRGLSQRIAFYNAGMTREDRARVESAFREGQLLCIISTSAFGEGVNIPDIRHVVLYHMPFDLVEFNQMAGRAGRDGQDAWIHVLFDAGDARINERILTSSAPSRDALAALYVSLKQLARTAAQTEEPDDEGRTFFSTSNADLAAMASSQKRGVSIDDKGVSTGIGIFGELGFLTTTGYGTARRISLVDDPRKMDLMSSIGYLEGLREREQFESFRDWVLGSEPEVIKERFDRPIIP